MEDTNTKIRRFTDLQVWQEAHSLVLDVYKVTKNFPSEERFGLTNQMRRSAVSVPSNIAEGFGRNTAKDKTQFYSIAKGSLLELQSQLYIAMDLNFVEQENKNNFDERIELIARLISGLIKSAISRV